VDPALWGICEKQLAFKDDVLTQRFFTVRPQQRLYFILIPMPIFAQLDYLFPFFHSLVIEIKIKYRDCSLYYQ
jgi:hypothetical protein